MTFDLLHKYHHYGVLICPLEAWPAETWDGKNVIWKGARSMKKTFSLLPEENFVSQILQLILNPRKISEEDVRNA